MNRNKTLNKNSITRLLVALALIVAGHEIVEHFFNGGPPNDSDSESGNEGGQIDTTSDESSVTDFTTASENSLPESEPERNGVWFPNANLDFLHIDHEDNPINEPFSPYTPPSTDTITQVFVDETQLTQPSQPISEVVNVNTHDASIQTTGNFVGLNTNEASTQTNEEIVSLNTNDASTQTISETASENTNEVMNERPVTGKRIPQDSATSMENPSKPIKRRHTV